MALKNLLVQFYFFLSYFLGFSQSAPLEKMGPLDPALDECSGLVSLGPNRFLAINDSGNDALIFVIDSTGKSLQQIPVAEIPNIDWESLAYFQGRLYIADIGNNRNRRRELSIYVLGIDSLLSHGRYRYEGEIQFFYPEQRQFPPPADQRYYDAEALIAYDDSLFIFTKNRTEPFDGYSQIYSLPTQPGRYAARWRGRLRTGIGLRPSFWVSGATLSPGGEQLCLLGYDKLWLIDQFPGRQFWRGRKRSYFFNQLAQMEGITFAGPDLYLGEERRGSGDAFLYRIKGAQLAQASAEEHYIHIEQREFRDSLFLEPLCLDSCQLRWELMSLDGRPRSAGEIYSQGGDSLRLGLDLRHLAPGQYIFNAVLHGRPHAYFVRKLEAIDK